MLRAIAAIVLFAARLGLGATPASAQPLSGPYLTVSVGWRSQGLGSVAEPCCGPTTEVDFTRFTGAWLGATLGRAVSSRAGLEGEATWTSPSNYSKIEQLTLAGQPTLTYRAENRWSSITVAGLVRWRAWHATEAGGIDVVAGSGVVRISRNSVLQSSAIRPGPFPTRPTIVVEANDTRYALPLIAGIDAFTSRGRTSIGGRFRIQHRLGAEDEDRPDLSPSGFEWRAGVIVMRAF